MKKILVSLFLLVFGLCLVGCTWRTGPDITNGGGFNVYYDYGTIEENKITILIDSCLPFFNFDDYNIEQLYPGDTLYIDYTGKPVIEESPIIYNVNFGHAYPIGIIPIGLECELNCENKVSHLKSTSVCAVIE